MNWKERQQRFSIRKLKVAVASIVVGILGFGGIAPSVVAQEVTQTVSTNHTSYAFNYHYVLESELTKQERQEILSQLPTDRVGAYSDYYMVYRPVGALPKTNSGKGAVVTLVGTGLLLIGVSFIKDKKKRVITSLALLTVGGASNASALPNNSVLSVYDEVHNLQVGGTIPETVLSIPNHEFVGYLLLSSDEKPQPLASSAVVVELPASQEVKEPARPVSPTQPVRPLEPAPVDPIVTEETEELAFDTEIQEDPNSPLGTETVIQTGVPGQKIKRYEDGVLVSEEIISQPVNRIVSRGTKVVESSRPTAPVSTEETEELAFDTEIQEDPNSPLGTETVIQAGVPGQKVKRYEDGVLVSEEIISQPVNRIVSRGTKVVESSRPTAPVSTEETEELAFDTEIQEDPNSPLGTETVIQTGVPGQKVKRYVDGLLVSETIISQPVKQIISRGTLVDTAADQPAEEPVVSTEAVDFDVEVIEDSNLPLGEEVLVQAGVAGVREMKTLNGQVISSQVIQAPVTQIMRRGTKVETPSLENRQQPIPFETIYQEDSNLAEGQEQTIQEGKAGLLEQTLENGQVVSERTVELPVNRIVKRGSKKVAVAPVEGTEVEESRQAIASPIVKEEDPHLWNGETVELPGETGEKLVKTTYKLLDGVRQPNPSVTEEIIRQATPTVIKEGTKPIEGTDTVISRETIQPGSREVKDADKYEDYREVTTQGQAGEVEVTSVYKTDKGVRVGEPEVTRRELRPVVDQVTTVGTKPIEGTDTVISRETIQPGSREVKDADKYEDYREVTTQGQAGEVEVTSVYKTDKGVRVGEPEETRRELRPVVDQVTTVGTKPINGTITVDTTATIPFKEEIRYDKTKLATEADEVIQPGKEGSKTITSVYNTVRGQQVGDPISQTEKTVVEAENRIILRGTRVLTEAEKQQPTAVKQVLEVGAEPIAKDSIDTTTLTKVRSYSWKPDATPSTLTAQEDVAGTVLVTYEDDSVDEVLVKVDVIQKKTKPILELENLDENDDDRTITLDYKLTDDTKAYTGATIGIFTGGQLVQTLELNNRFEPFEVDNLEWDVPYVLKTTLKYDVGNGVQTEALPDKPFELEYKKLEIKDVDSLSLYRLEDGQFVKQSTLAGAVSNPSDYFVRISSDRFRDMLLPVKSIKEETRATGGTAFRVTTDIEELVEDKDASAISNYQDQFSFLVKKTQTNPNIFTSFKALVEAIRRNPTGNFVLGDDLDADELTIGANASAYITGDFRGTLMGSSEGQAYAIRNTKVPLFHSLVGATISNLDLKNVAINSSNSNLAALANNATGSSRVTDVSVQGSLTTLRGVAGVVHNVVESTLTNTSFTGKLTTTATTAGGSNVGGVVGVMTRGTVQKSYAKADITVNGVSNDVRVGGLVGFNNNGYLGANFRTASMIDVYTEGTLTKNGTLGYAGGIVGSTEHGQYQGRVQNGVTKMVVVNGNPIYGYTNILPNSMANTYTTTGTAQPQTGRLTTEEADARIAAMGITTNLTDSVQADLGTLRSTDYTSLNKASKDRAIAYDNIEKLIPFYNKELVVKYGNMVDTNDKLYTTKLLSVTPMKDDTIVSDVNSVKEGLNRLMLHYADNSVAYLNVTYTGNFKNAAVSEYAITGTPLIYTPEQFLSSYDAILNAVLPELEAVSYKSMAMVDQIKPYSQGDVLSGVITKARAHTKNSLNYVMNNTDTVIAVLMQVVRMNATDATNLVRRFEQETVAELTANETVVGTQMDKLYLEPTFNAIKANLAGHLRQVLATDKSINTSGGVVDSYVTNYIKANKERLLLGLAYMNRWYNVDFQTTNIKDLATYHQDFFGKQVNTLEWLVGLGSNYETLLAANNVTTHANHIAPNTTKSNLLNYLTYNRQLFTNYKTDNDWFKETSKAYIVEQQSEELPERVVRVYDTLSLPAEQNGILPLLTAKEGIFIITSLGGITYGMYDRYLDETRNRNDYEARHAANLTHEQKIEKIKEFVNRAAKRQGDHFDVWYRLAPANVRNNLIKPGLTTWDGYLVRGNWLPMYGSGANDAILDFFGPIGERSGVANNGSGAYATGSKTAFVNNRVLDNYGMSVYTHEVVHNNDSGIYLGGFGRREGMGPEAFPLGLLQSSSYGGHAAGFITLNLAFDYEQYREARNRDTNVTPNRFETSADLKEYMHGVFDVLYTLDYAEAQAAVNRTTATQKQAMFGVIENFMAGVHAGNKIRALTTEEAEKLTSWEKFIDTNIIGRREYSLQQYSRNGYYHSYLFSPNYAALSNDTGAPGDLMFRRIAFELMADKGYEAGFIPYTSNQLKPNASTVLTDQHVLKGIYGDTYGTWADFKKAMFQERINKLDRLTATTITYLGRQVTINSFADLQNLMNEAVAYDAGRTITVNQTNSRVHDLKRAIYNAYLRQTDDFNNSIFK